MKKFYLLTKTLLVAALLMVGASSAWAGEVSTIYSKALSGWSSDDITASSSTFTAGKWTPSQTGDANKGLWTSTTTGLMTRCRQNTVTGTLTLDRTAYTIVTLDAVWNVGDNDNNGGGHTNGYSQYNYFQYGDLLIATCLDNRSTDYSYTINGVKTTFSNVTAGCLLNTDLTIHIVVNSISGEISEFYIKNGETFLAQYSDLGPTNKTFTGSANYDKVITTAYTNVSRTNAFNYLKSITVQQETQSVPTANVTFKYEDTAGTSLSSYKSDQVMEGVALGTTISTLIASPYTDTFFNGTSNKYIYNSYSVTGDYTTVQEGGNTVTLKFTDYPATAYTVKAQVSGSDLTTLASGTAYLDGSSAEYWSKYIKVSDNWYVADETTYGAAITSATTNVAFSATDDIDYFFEAENMTCSRQYGSFTNNNSYSNGGGIGVYQKSYLTSTSKIAAGIYTVAITGIVRNSDKTVNFKISYSTDGSRWNDTGKNVTYTTNSSGATTGSVTEVIIPAESYIRLTDATGANVNDYTDYITFKKTADIPTTENIVVTSAGYATYVSNYNLNFTSATTKAYKVSVAEKGVATMTLVDEVPAKTPVLLYVAGGNGEGEAIPVTTEAVSAVSGNNLVAGTGAAVPTYETVSTENDYTNMILNNGSEGIGFYFANGQTVAANRAYLHIASTLAPDAVAGARGMSLVIDDEKITGISEAEASTEAVVKEGKFIIDGKLVIFKKGMKFNANGQLVK